MAIVVVESNAKNKHGTRFEDDLSRGIVVLESTCEKTRGNFSAAFAELDSQDARAKALGHAAQSGVGDPRVNGSPTAPYPVNKEGVPLELVKDKDGNTPPLTDPRMAVHRYRVDVPVTRRLV